jgi:predicted branched-subunit amino acid permease
MKIFFLGFKSILPIVPGILPFGAVMGSAFAEANLTLPQAMLMNSSVYAGASQLATVDLMKLDAAVLVVVATGLIINLRFLLYSAAMSPYLARSSVLVKLVSSYALTDQSYASMSAHQDKFHRDSDAVVFYLGTVACMFLFWTSSVVLGFSFGNFAPPSLSLDFAISLSFVALLIPTLKSRLHVAVAVFSSIASVLLNGLPFRAGLMITALLAIAFAATLIRRSKHD